MNSFKSDGVYLSVNDKRKNGYLTWGSDGKLKKHNYGIVDKLYDLYYYGKTKEIQYNYIHFYSSRRNTNNELIMSFGTVEGDIMSVLEYFKSSKFHISHQNKIDFTYINENKIKYYDTKNSECSITSTEGGNILLKEYTNYYDNLLKVDSYRFFYVDDDI